jgi:hypothetical protein
VPGLKTPRDLALLPLAEKPWPLDERVATAKICTGEYNFKLVALTITLADYPDSIPVNNCCGAACHGQYHPWGMNHKDLGRTLPAGYAVTPDGTPLIAFQDPKDSLQYLIRLVERRRILQGDEFSKFWRNAAVGSSAWNDALLAFEDCLNRVIVRY